MNVGEGLIAFDLALGASSRSGKRVHVGLRSLECCKARLACETLIEREILLNSRRIEHALTMSPDELASFTRGLDGAVVRAA